MSTPSEVFAGGVLDRVLKFDEVVFVDKTYDYEAHDEKYQYVIEVKFNVLPLRQMKALAKKHSKGVKALLLVVDKSIENYCLFELASTNLASPPSPSIEPQKVARLAGENLFNLNAQDVPDHIPYLLVSMRFLRSLLETGKRWGEKLSESEFKALMHIPLSELIDQERLLEEIEMRVEEDERERLRQSGRQS